MRFNYLDILKNHGFIIPPYEGSFDDRTYSQISDNRERELNSIIMLAFHNLKYCGKKSENILLFQTLSKAQYYVEVKEDGIKATLQKTSVPKSVFEQHDFIIQKDSEGNIIFKQLQVYESKNIVLKTFIVDKPSYTNGCAAYIDGFDATTFELFLSSIQPDAQASYIDLFTAFLEESGIIPDISRKITVLNNNQFKPVIYETDHFTQEYSSPLKSVSAEKVTVHFSLIESYIRARDFDHIITISQGLSDSVQDELALKLKMPKDN